MLSIEFENGSLQDGEDQRRASEDLRDDVENGIADQGSSRERQEELHLQPISLKQREDES